MAESGSGLCSEDGNCAADSAGIFSGATLLISVISSAVVLIIVVILIFCCVTGVGRYLRRKKRYDLNNNCDGILIGNPACTIIENQSHRSSALETTDEIFNPNTVTTEFSYASSEMNSNPTSSRQLLAQSALETPTSTSHSQHTPPILRPRDEYDRLIRVSTANGTMMVLQNEPSTPLTFEEGTVIENIHRDEDTTLEGISSAVKYTKLEKQPRHFSELETTRQNCCSSRSTTHTNSHSTMSTTVPATDHTNSDSEAEYVNVLHSTSADSMKQYATSDRQAGREYSYATRHSLYSPKPEDNGVFTECQCEHGFDHHLHPHINVGSTFPNQPHSNETTVQDPTYCNLPQNCEVPDSIQLASDLDRSSVAPGLKKSVPSNSPVQQSEATTKAPLYTSLIGREVHYQDYDKLSSMQHTCHKCLQSSPPKPRIARQPKQIVSSNTSRMEYENITVWLNAEKKPHQSVKSSSLSSGYTPLLHSTRTKKSNYDNAFRQERPTSLVIVRTQTLV